VTPHSPAFLSACAHVSALLGPADATEDIVEPYPATIARWGHAAGANLTVRHYGITGSVVLVAERRADDREWRAIGDGTVRDAAAWLGWAVPRVTLPGLAPPRNLLPLPDPQCPVCLNYAGAGAPFCAGCGPLVPPPPPNVRTLGPRPVEHRTAPPFAVETDSLADLFDALDADAERRARKAAPVGYDANGRLTAGDDGCGLVFADPTGDAA
jgi:hypothetical protein